MPVATPYTDAILALPDLISLWSMGDDPSTIVMTDIVGDFHGEYRGGIADPATNLPARGIPSLVRSEQSDGSVRFPGIGAARSQIPGNDVHELGADYTVGVSLTINSGLANTSGASNGRRCILSRNLGGYLLWYSVTDEVPTLTWHTERRELGAWVPSADLSSVVSVAEGFHVYATFDGTETRLYLNGQRVAQVSDGGIDDNESADPGSANPGLHPLVRVGPRAGFGVSDTMENVHAGGVDALFMADSSIDDAAALALFEATQLDPYQAQLGAIGGLVAHWKLDEPSEGTTVAVDSVGANDGAYINAAQNEAPFVGMATPSLIPQEPGSGSASAHAALTVEGGEHVRVPDDSSLEPTTQMTIGVTYRPHSNDFGDLVDQTLIQKGALSAYVLRVGSDGSVEFGVSRVEGNTSVEAPSGTVALDSVYDMAASFDGAGSGAYLIVNGELVAQSVVSGTLDHDHSTFTSDLFIGTGFLAPSSLDDVADGSFDEVFLASAAITIDEAQALHAASVAISPPDVTTGSASDIGPASASLHGSVNPASWQTAYWFEYGPTVSYGSSVPVGNGDAGLGDLALAVSADTLELAPDTIYHYRLVGENTQGVAYGADETFQTGGALAPGTFPSRVGVA